MGLNGTRFKRCTSLLALFLAGCSLSSDVSIGPLLLLPSDTRNGAATIAGFVGIGDYPQAILLGEGIESRPRVSSQDLAALGSAELAAGRIDAARRHLRTALDLKPFHTEVAHIAWDLSQTEYLANNYASAAEWAHYAVDRGLAVKDWHISYLESLVGVDVYHFSGRDSVRQDMVVEKPSVPRIQVTANNQTLTAIVDTGAALSIISAPKADKAGVRRLGDFKGTFYGLLGEPISVSFGLIDRLQIGGMTIANVPVAIMDESKMRFVSDNRQPFDIGILIGTNLLKEFKLDFNFRSGSLTMTHLKESDHNPAPDQNLFIIGSRPLVHGTINRHGWYLFVLDTGSEITFLNETEVATTPKLRQLPQMHGALLQGLGGTMKHGTRIENIEVGIDKWAGTFRQIPLYSSEKNEAFGIIGENMLKHFRLTIDFGSMRVTLKPDRIL